MRDKICLTSNGPYSGKTTLAQGLAARGYMLVSHSETLVRDYVRMFNERVGDEMMISVEQVYAHKGTFRRGLQQHGRAVGFDTDGMWVMKTLRPWLEAKPQPPVVFDNARTDEQASLLRSLGFLVVNVYISDAVRYERSRAAGVPDDIFTLQLADRAERGIDPSLIDVTVYGVDPIETSIATIRSIR